MMQVKSDASDASDALLGAIYDAARSDDPCDALRELLANCVAQTGSTRGTLYLLDLANHRLTRLHVTAHGDDKSPEYIGLRPSVLAKAHPAFRQALQTRRPVRIPPGDLGSLESQLLVPILREDSCMGIVRLVHAHESFEESAVARVQLIAQFATLLLEKRYSLQLLTVIEKPINYGQPREKFLDELMLLAAEASGFPYIVLRELDKDGTALDCVRSFGYSDVDQTSLNLAPLSDYPLFEAAVRERSTQIIERDVAGSETVITSLAISEELQRVVIVPIVVGDAVFGTASFSVACDHNISRLEQRGLEAIANSLGGAIASYRNVGLAHEVFFERAKAAAALTTVDVAQAARHEARNYVHNAQTNMTTLSRMLTKLTGKGRIEPAEIIDAVFDDLGRIDNALDKIKSITKPIDHVANTCELAQLWQEAFELVGGRLNAMNVRYTIRGRVSVMCIPELLRHGFLQLILNSVDAFKESGKKRGHTIAVTIEDTNDSLITMRYTDNGPGLDFTKLVAKDGHSTRKSSDIFLAGVTTKETGSGYGLYLVRRALDAHHGSIDLLDHRNCMSFKIELARTAPIAGDV